MSVKYVVFRKILHRPHYDDEDYDADVEFCCICKTKDEAKIVCDKKEKEAGIWHLYSWEYAEVKEVEENIKLEEV